jgi:hypothetical protein
MTADDVLESLVEECRQDHVGLCEIVRAAQLDLGAADPMQTRAVTLQLVRDLLSERKVQAGYPTPDGQRFVAWEGTPAEVLRRIERDWAALGREPDIGEVVWFTAQAGG